MPPAVRSILGAVLLIIGIVDLLQFGWKILLSSPALIIGVVFTAAGTALLTAGRKSLP